MNIRQATCKLTSISPLSQSAFIASPKKKDETHDEHALRVWREKMHVSPGGIVYIPGMALKYAIDEAAKRMGRPTGKSGGKELFGKFFQTGLQVDYHVQTGVAADDVTPTRVMCDSTGKKGKQGGTRVPRYFPNIPKWSGELSLTVYDETIPADLVEETVEYAGIFVGVGQFRPENQGSFGRFKPSGWKWAEL